MSQTPPQGGANTRFLLDRMARRRQEIGGFRAKANKHRSRSQHLADYMTRRMGSVPFMVLHFILFIVWFTINLRILTGVQPFDLYPFGLLTMILTLEQSVLTIFILISQNRTSDLDELRNEIDLQVNVLAEEEISKALRLLHLIGQHMNIDEIINDAELKVMETSLDHQEMEKETVQELGEKVSRIATATQWTESE
jgi:uncharacterized membrane protein